MDTNMVQLGLPTTASSVPDAVLNTGAGKAEALPLKKMEVAQAQPKPVKEQVAFDAGKSDETRFENMRQASQLFKDVFAVSDTKFSIYKDFKGQFVTRFTNLRDGSVSYIPEPDMMLYLEQRGKARKALLKIDV
ncbi:MAG: hypothetical protein MK052_01110 [Alphaproteobacteria bacterium]|nr:hypothetical protein [Alphaproteobacteria bacterium]